MKILVADDDRDIRRSLSSYLEDQGHTVLQAQDGRDAIEAAQSQAPDLVLLDLRMPRLDGLATLRKLHETHADLPVIVISGAGQVSDAIEAMRRGAWDYLAKPIDDLSVLTIAIEKATEKQEMRRQIREHQVHLEEQVRQRTAELQVANEALQGKALALREVLNAIQEEKRQYERDLISRIETTVLPLVQRAREQSPRATQALLAQVEHNLGAIAAPLGGQLARKYGTLTPSEIRICQLIRRGMSSKEIAQAEGISVETVDTHRRNVRRKLNIANEQVNLATYLQSLDELQ